MVKERQKGLHDVMLRHRPDRTASLATRPDVDGRAVLQAFAKPTGKPKRPLRNGNAVRLLWSVDKTGSMHSLIRRAKSASRDFFRRTQELQLGLEVCWCPYGDYVDFQSHGMTGLLEPSDWVGDVDQLVTLIGHTQLVGGGDADEAVEYLLQYACEMESADAVVLIGDANPHSAAVARRQVAQYGVPVQGELDWRENASRLGTLGRPVYSFPLRPGCRTVFEEIAQRSGGEMGELDNLDALIDMLSLSVAAVGGENYVRRYLELRGDSMSRQAQDFALKLLPPGDSGP